jgi:hypothetical protein
METYYWFYTTVYGLGEQASGTSQHYETFLVTHHPRMKYEGKLIKERSPVAS